MTLYDVAGPETHTLTLPDGVRLDADVYRPMASGDFPVLLVRQPYGRKIAVTVVFAHAAWYASHGYVVVIQDVRGRGTSGGRFRLFQDDVGDGAATVAWAARLPGTTGKVGMYGFSYQGVTQLLALASGAPELATICPAMCGYDIYSDWAYEGGAFCFSSGLSWGIQMAAEQARIAGDERAFNALLSASRNLPLNEPRPYLPQVIESFGSYAHYPDWIAHPNRDAYWDALSPRNALSGRPINIPILHVGGWYDSFLMGTIGFFKDAAALSAAPQKLIIGPWTHIPWGCHIGAIDMGADAVSDIDRCQLTWFDRTLKGVDNGAFDAPAIRLFDLVAKRWQSLATWPPGTAQRWQLASVGLSATTRSGQLSRSKPAATVVDRLVHDPWRPVPSLGGHNAIPGGMQNRAAIDDRTDVLTYTSLPLDEPIALAGEVSAELQMVADQPSYDVSVVLSRVTPAGAVFNLTQGHTRVDGASEGPLRVAMRATCATLERGDALRLSVAAANFPAFAVNPGNGADPLATRLIDCRVTTLSLTTGGAGGSLVSLPILALGEHDHE